MNIINIEIFLTRMFWWDKSIICVAVIVAVDYYPVYSYSDAGMQRAFIWKQRRNR